MPTCPPSILTSFEVDHSTSFVTLSMDRPLARRSRRSSARSRRRVVVGPGPVVISTSPHASGRPREGSSSDDIGLLDADGRHRCAYPRYALGNRTKVVRYRLPVD